MRSHPLDRLAPRGKAPATVRAVETWIQEAEDQAGVGARRLGWMVASGVVIAAIQRVSYDDGLPRFLLKGGTYLELRLGMGARATRDVDTLYRGSFPRFLDTLDRALVEPFDGITFKRTEPQIIDVPGRIHKPRRLDILLQIRGRTWRRICLEISPDEGGAGESADQVHPPSLAHFGLSTPSTTAAILMDYQVAQKFHACTDPHSEEHPNDRVRDIVDLHLLKSAFYGRGQNMKSLAVACLRLFASRAQEARETGEVTPRPWPPQVVAHPHWQTDYRAYAQEVELDVTLEEAVQEINSWVGQIQMEAEIG